MTAMRSLMLSASSWSWVTNTNVIPTSSWSAFSSTRSCLRSFASSAPSGSSSSSTRRAQDERAGERDALLLAAGELARPALLEAVELDQLERLARRARVDSSFATPPAAQPERDVVEDVRCGNSA